MNPDFRRSFQTYGICVALLVATGCPSSSDDNPSGAPKDAATEHPQGATGGTGGTTPVATGGVPAGDAGESTDTTTGTGGVTPVETGGTGGVAPAEDAGESTTDTPAGTGGVTPVETGGAGGTNSTPDAAGLPDTMVGHGGSGGTSVPIDSGGQPETAPPTNDEPIGVAVISTDGATAALSLAGLGASAVSKDECVHSGTTSPKLTVPWSTDLRISSGVLPHHEIAVIDRANSTVTRIAGETCDVIQQIAFGGGFATHPVDYVGALPSGRAYATRPNTNPANAGEGGDIAILDTTLGTMTGRIDLRAEVPGGGPSDKPWLPFPMGALLVDGKVYVVINFKNVDESSFAESRLVVIDPNSDTVVARHSMAIKGCGALQPFWGKGTGHAFISACTGGVQESPNVTVVDVGKNPSTATPGLTFSAEGLSSLDVAGYDSFAAVISKGQIGGQIVSEWALDSSSPPFYGSFGPLLSDFSAFQASLRLAPDHRHLYVAVARGSAQSKVQILDLANVTASFYDDDGNFIANPAHGRKPRQLGFF